MARRRRDHRGVGRTDVFSRAEVEALAHRLLGMISNAKAEVSIESEVTAGTQFARGDAHRGTETASASVTLTLFGADRQASASTTRYDDAGLALLVAESEAAARQWHGTPQQPALLGPQVYKTPPKIYFEANLPLMTPGGRAALYNAALDATEAVGLIGAGDIYLRRSCRAAVNTEGLLAYTASTYGEFSLTARTKDGTGSGWEWSGFEDWSRVDRMAVIATAVDLARRTANPVAVEPGRYTVILEPAAVASLIQRINWDARLADLGSTVFSKEPLGTNKIGLQMLDERLHMVSDPWDPDAPQTTVGWSGEPLDTVQWFKDGVLRALAYGHGYAHAKGRETVLGPGNLRLYATGAPASLDEMIATTKRGVWVHRLSDVRSMNDRTMLLTGTTRDGTLLIENGKITKAIKNFRFTESPFFVFNKLEAAGTPVRAAATIVAPRLKVRDFDFTSLTDAV